MDLAGYTHAEVWSHHHAKLSTMGLLENIFVKNGAKKIHKESFVSESIHIFLSNWARTKFSKIHLRSGLNNTRASAAWRSGINRGKSFSFRNIFNNNSISYFKRGVLPVLTIVTPTNGRLPTLIFGLTL